MAGITTNHMVSGVHTAIEYPDRVARFQRFGWGLQVEQEADPPGRHHNWFHMGIPYIQSDSRASGGTVPSMFLQMELNENARLAQVRLHAGRLVVFDASPGIVDQSINQTFDVDASFADNPFSVALRVEFLSGDPLGRVTFLGAGLQIISNDPDTRL